MYKPNHNPTAEPAMTHERVDAHVELEHRHGGCPDRRHTRGFHWIGANVACWRGWLAAVMPLASQLTRAARPRHRRQQPRTAPITTTPEIAGDEARICVRRATCQRQPGGCQRGHGLEQRV